MAISPAETPSCLTDSDVAEYHKNGFLVVPNALTQKEIEAMRAETAAICRGDRGEVRNLPKHNVRKA